MKTFTFEIEMDGKKFEQTVNAATPENGRRILERIGVPPEAITWTGR